MYVYKVYEQKYMYSEKPDSYITLSPLSEEEKTAYRIHPAMYRVLDYVYSCLLKR